MSTLDVVHGVGVDTVPLLGAAAWRSDVRERLRHHDRLLTMFGRRVGEEVLVTSVIRGVDGSLGVTRALIPVETGYHELTTEFPAVHCFERELHEQTGIRVAGHPWLKPIRYEGDGPLRMATHPYYMVEGKEVHEVAVGPVHAGVIEPGSFRFMCLGERVHHLEIQLGYQHRGVERRLLEGNPARLGPIVETIAGDSSVAHAWAYAAAIERLGGLAVDADVEVGRAFMLELERVAMHLATLAGLAADVGFQQGAATYGRLRTNAINATMLLCGSRFGRTAVRPGGTGMRGGADVAHGIRAHLDLLRRDLPAINDCFVTAQSVQHRLREVGPLSAERATELGLVGVVARASGVPIDARQRRADGPYSSAPIRASVSQNGDCWARATQRVEEIDASLEWLADAARRLAIREGSGSPTLVLAPSTLVVAVVEGFRGEVVHCLETDARGALAHYKVHDPSFRNWMGLAVAVRDEEISDFPICNKSFDLSYCGNDL